jgi:flagellar motility protein MotE (MotC chaperone)
MARVPLVVVSAVSAFVLFLVTSAGLLAAQGRLGNFFGKSDAAQTDPKDSDPKEGDPASKSAGGADRTASAPSPKPPAATGSGSAVHGAVKVADGHGAPPAAVKGAPEPPPVKRIATASLVHSFKLPEPFTASELEELVTALRENRDAHSRWSNELSAQRAANERDRLDLEARFAELDEIRKRLDQQKIEVSTKVAELSKRNDQLTAGEDKFVKATVARLATLKVDEAKTHLLTLDDALAARVLHKMEPKLCAKLLVSLPAEKSVTLTKLLRAISLAEADDGSAAKPGDAK